MDITKELVRGKELNIPVRLINVLNTKVDDVNQNVKVKLKESINEHSYPKFRVEVEGYTNTRSVYGDYYINKKELLNYLTGIYTSEKPKCTYIYKVVYPTRNNLTKYIGCDTKYYRGELVLINSNSQDATVVEIIEVYDQNDLNYYNLINILFNRFIICRLNEAVKAFYSKSINSIIEEENIKLKQENNELKEKNNKLKDYIINNIFLI